MRQEIELDFKQGGLMQIQAPPVSVSQNFLTSSKTIQRLVGLTNLCRDDHVIEIDPGKGHVTEVLAKTCGRVTATPVRVPRALTSELKEFYILLQM